MAEMFVAKLGKYLEQEIVRVKGTAVVQEDTHSQLSAGFGGHDRSD